MAILFLCQSASLSFFKLAALIVGGSEGATFLTGSSLGVRSWGKLVIKEAPPYVRSSAARRLFSWLHYSLHALTAVLTAPRGAIVVTVTNPPSNVWLAYLGRRVRGHHYVAIVWDIYPDVLNRLGYCGEQSIVSRAWQAMNSIAYRHASFIVTLGVQMSETLKRQIRIEDHNRIHVIPTAVDTTALAPVAKEENSFARRHGQNGCLTVLYSGNMGATHSLDCVTESAYRLREHRRISFLLVGDGFRRAQLERDVQRLGLANVTLLSRQSEEVLGLLLASGDIGLVSLDNGVEGISVPSKTYALMAAGCALIGICQPGSDLALTIGECGCGVSVPPGDPDALANAILVLANDPALLRKYRNAARHAAVTRFSIEACAVQFSALFEECALLSRTSCAAAPVGSRAAPRVNARDW